MCRRTFVLLPIVLLLVALSTAQSVMLAREDSSPIPSGAAGVSTRQLGGGQSSSAVAAGIGLVRLTFWPGATLGERSEPGVSVLYIESGRLGYRLVEGHAWITRALTGMGPADGASSPKQLTPGDVVLTAGVSLFAEADVVYAAWNAGDAPALVTIATLVQPDQQVPSLF